SDLGSTCNAANNYASPCCSADYDKNNAVNVSDIFAFLRGWFSHSHFADANNSGGSPDVSDIFAFLRSWFSTNGHCSTTP
ncbi:MAG TPA: GC-type dockerin domain-anchored protein, partial [Terriglobales bacterium]|nr:GC-type dockerin domain-anchored protein [Terriglobales bacterium]